MRRRARRETPAGLTGLEVTAAKRLFFLGGDDEKKESKAAIQVESEEDKATATATADEGSGDLYGDGPVTGTRRHKFRSLAQLYEITQPIRLLEESKKRKLSREGDG